MAKSSALTSATDRRGSVTLSDVAAMAGVAPITVSRALNNPAIVSRTLRSRIDAAIAALDYVPNRIAGALASAKTKVIPVIVPSLSNVVFVEVIQGIQPLLEAQGYQMLLGSTDYDLDREAALASTLLGWAPPGVLIAGLRHLPRTTGLLSKARLPVVEFMEYGTRPIDMNVGLSHGRAGAAMAEHLLARGYRKLGFVGSRIKADYRAQQRYEGMQEHCRKMGVGEVFLFEVASGNDQDIGWQSIIDVLRAQPSIDALFFANDEMAVGALLRAQREAIAVPSRVAIAGFNGLPISRLVTPALTTIVSPREHIGRLAAAMLLGRIRSTASQNQPQVDVGFSLEARAST